MNEMTLGAKCPKESQRQITPELPMLVLMSRSVISSVGMAELRNEDFDPPGRNLLSAV